MLVNFYIITIGEEPRTLDENDLNTNKSDEIVLVLESHDLETQGTFEYQIQNNQSSKSQLHMSNLSHYFSYNNCICILHTSCTISPFLNFFANQHQ